MPSFQSMTISDVVEDINYSYLLPAIQRDFVWDADQMLDLFDSVVRDYPIGAFLFWKVSGDYANKRVKYKFIENYIEGPIYPDEITDVTHHNKRFLDEYNNIPNKINLVLDGQQRLSTLYIGLKGTYTERGYNQKKDRIQSWTRKQLYLNILSDPDVEHSGRKYHFEFKQPSPERTRDKYWYKVGNILNVTEPAEEVNDIVDNVEEIEGITVEEVNEYRKIINRNINSLYRAINEREIITFFTESEESQDKVLDIFIRTNEGGTQLSRSDVLLSIATAQWQSDGERIVAREEIDKFVDELNAHDARGGVSFDANFILRALLLCSGTNNLSFTLENFDKDTLSVMKETWIDPKFKQSILTTLDLIKSFGLTTSNIHSKSIILPVVYYNYRNDNPSLAWGSESGKKNRKNILYWLSSMVVTGEMNTGGTIQTIQGVRNVIKEDPNGDFNINKIETSLRKYNKSMGFDDEQIDRWLSDPNISSSKIRPFLCLIYFPDVASEQYTYEIDHIFPRKLLKADCLSDEFGYSPSKALQIEQLGETAANMQLINAKENRTKSDTPPAEWIDDRSSDYFDHHTMPQKKHLYKLGNFEDFISERSDLIRSELCKNTPDRPLESQGTI